MIPNGYTDENIFLKLKLMFIPGKALGMGSHMGFHVPEDEPHQALQKIQK